ARIILSQAATYVACAPKSNAAYLAIDAAMSDVREKATVPVPVHLQDAHYAGSARLGRGQDYQYAHDFEEGYVPQDYGVPRGTYYHPRDRGKESEFQERLRRFDERDHGG
ncbi:MAG: replication-associated recombination protein A, partial [Candidatus Hydrogenedentes bacterium]|nr:replication-associated recombination protein A [Candidatus Hydrogenedentota bacterium]